jgi:hypothetical protein
MSQPTKEEWEAIRHKWENTPRLSLNDAGEGFGVSRQSISVRAKKEGWEKRTTLSAINQQAHRLADGIDKTDGVVKVDNLVDTQGAVDIRAAILANQREEIKLIPLLQDKAVELFNTAVEASDAAKISDDATVRNREKAAWYCSKLAIECVLKHTMVIQLKHDTEAKAWGLDMYEFEENRLTPNLHLLTVEELTQIAEKGTYPAYMTKGLRE